MGQSINKQSVLGKDKTHESENRQLTYLQPILLKYFECALNDFALNIFLLYSLWR